MRKINLEPKAIYDFKDGIEFILLGSEDINEHFFLTNVVAPKIDRRILTPVPGLWGTLGMSKNEKVGWKGCLEISEHGNNEFRGVVKNEVRLIREAHNLDENTKIIERFISFEHVEFDFWNNEFIQEDIPEIRLTQMLKPNEGALVFYQYYDKKLKKDTIDYIQPNPTPDNETNKRDRLTYEFKAIPRNYYEPIPGKENVFRLSASPTNEKFVVKIIVFERGEHTDSESVLKTVKNNLSKQEEFEKHTLLKFNKYLNNFEFVTGENIAKDKKTLLLIHGTFASTKKTFRALYGNKKKKSSKNTWLLNMLAENGGKYEQIIAFDHPTVSDDAKMNVDRLFEMLEGDFADEVDIIGSSQGGLIAQYIANLKQENSRITVGKVALVSSANGVDYFTVGKYISRFLTIMKYISGATGRTGATLICTLAQHSADFFLQQPGMQLMTPKSERLDYILNKKPTCKSTIYLPIAGDFDKVSRKRLPGYLRPILWLTDIIVRPFMTKYNDLVVKTENQFKTPEGYSYYPEHESGSFKKYMISALHSKAFYTKEAKEQIRNFLLTELKKENIS